MSQYTQTPFNRALDLSVARDRVEIVPPGTWVAQWKISLLPAGAELRVHLGTAADGLRVNAADLLTIPGGHGSGIYVSNPAQAGLNAEIIIVPGPRGGL